MPRHEFVSGVSISQLMPPSRKLLLLLRLKQALLGSAFRHFHSSSLRFSSGASGSHCAALPAMTCTLGLWLSSFAPGGGADDRALPTSTLFFTTVQPYTSLVGERRSRQ